MKANDAVDNPLFCFDKHVIPGRQALYRQERIHSLMYVAIHEINGVIDLQLAVRQLFFNELLHQTTTSKYHENLGTILVIVVAYSTISALCVDY